MFIPEKMKLFMNQIFCIVIALKNPISNTVILKEVFVKMQLKIAKVLLSIETIKLLTFILKLIFLKLTIFLNKPQGQ